MVGVFTKECLAIDEGKRLTGEDVVATLQRITSRRPFPKKIYCDNGPEFIG